MSKLNQIIAIEKGIKSRVYGELTDLNKASQKAELFSGFTKSYLKKDEDGEDLPAEKKRVQYTVPEVLRAVERVQTELIDVTARKDFTNCVAKADVVVGGKVIVQGAPVSFLLFLEKQLNDVHTLVTNLPVLDEAEAWVFDANAGMYRTEPKQTHRTKKVAKPIVLYPATPEHPAQTQMVSEDIIAGFWSQVQQSGAMPKPEKLALLTRIETLARAVKEAREAANMQDEVPVAGIGASIFGFIMGA
jgi:hypothetical protein